MDNSDLLYTNVFRNPESLSKEQLQKNANNFVPYRTLKTDSVNNVRDQVERSVFTSNPIVDRENKAYGWNRGGLGNQDPVLSDFARDIGESSYYRYRTSYLNIDSRLRDFATYPQPNNYQVFLGKKFNNVEAVKIVDYFFPDMPYPINERNNTIMWFTIPYEILNINNPLAICPEVPYLPSTSAIEIFQWDVNFYYFLNDKLDCKEAIEKYRVNSLNCINTIEIPPGFYTTTELERKIEELWRETVFFRSTSITYVLNKTFIPDKDSPTIEFIGTPQLVKVRIDPITSVVDFMLRYEELEIDYMRSYKGKNYVDIRLKSLDPNVPSEEYTILANNTIYPLIPTDFPSVGGLNSSLFNYIEFAPATAYFALKKCLDRQIYKRYDVDFRYYDIVKDPDTGIPIPNVLRLYINTIKNLSIKASSNQIIDGTCIKLCDARIGRDAPFFMINGTSSPFFNFISSLSNLSGTLYISTTNPNDCFTQCGEGDPFVTKEFCRIIPESVQEEVNGYLINLDCSSRALTNFLGFPNTDNSLAQVGPRFFAFGINPNYVYKSNNYLATVRAFNIESVSATNYLLCNLIIKGTDPVNTYAFFDYISETDKVDFKLPICKNPNGTFSFYADNYMFLKLINPAFQNQISNSQIIQVRSSSTYAFGSGEKYFYKASEVEGLTLSTLEPIPDPNDVCFNTVPSLYKNKLAGDQELSKDVENLFAKIKFSGTSGGCSVENPFVNEVVYFEGSVVNLDSFVVQIIDYEGKIVQSNKEHSFTLMIVEKIEVLKETGVSSRTGFSNSVGIQQVHRNNFSM